jgi:hypothetical protein
MNKLFVGFNKTVEPPARGLFIHDDVPDISRARVFDPAKHSFNPLKNIDYRKARALADVLYAAAPQGENTLTVRNGKRALLKALLSASRLDKMEGDDEVTGMIDDLRVEMRQRYGSEPQKEPEPLPRAEAKPTQKPKSTLAPKPEPDGDETDAKPW